MEITQSVFEEACEGFLLVVALVLVLALSGFFDYEDENDDENEPRPAFSKRALSPATLTILKSLSPGLRAARYPGCLPHVRPQPCKGCLSAPTVYPPPHAAITGQNPRPHRLLFVWD